MLVGVVMNVALSSVHRSMLACVYITCVYNVNGLHMYMYPDWWQPQRLTEIHILHIPEIPRCDNCLMKSIPTKRQQVANQGTC